MPAGVASFHLVRYPRRGAPRAALAMATDRRHLARTDGLVLGRLLGTGAGSSTAPGADLRRWAFFGLWRDQVALDAFLAASPIARRWQAADEAWHVRMVWLGGHGRWRGVDPSAVVTPASRYEGPVVVTTRAGVRPARWARFRGVQPAVDRELQAADGLVAACAFGEAPVGRQGTFSIWRDQAALTAFARSPSHADAVRRTRAERWYGEELFARWAPIGSEGRWDGHDPLGATRSGWRRFDGRTASEGTSSP